MGSVLLAEDDGGVRVMVGNVLRQAGHRIHFASDGVEAIDCIQKNAYDCISST